MINVKNRQAKNNKEFINKPKGVKIKNNKIDQIKKDIKNSFKGLAFNEKLHKYTYKSKVLISTTTFLKRFYEEFDELYYLDLIANNTNRKRKILKSSSLKRSEKYYKQRWESINEESKLRGHRVHNYAETNYPDFLDKPHCEQELGIVEFFKDLPKNYVVLFCELRMFDKKFNKAGTSDLILYNLNTDKIIIADYKTNNKSLITYYKNSYFLKPFSNLKNHELNKYSLQLSDYQNFIEMNTQYKVEERWIIHLTTKSHKEFDVSKLDKKNYCLDLDNSPDIDSKYYKIYKTKDYSKELASCY